MKVICLICSLFVFDAHAESADLYLSGYVRPHITPQIQPFEKQIRINSVSNAPEHYKIFISPIEKNDLKEVGVHQEIRLPDNKPVRIIIMAK